VSPNSGTGGRLRVSRVNAARPLARWDPFAPSLEFPLIALRAVDDHLVIDRQPRRPAALVFLRDAAALDGPVIRPPRPRAGGLIGVVVTDAQHPAASCVPAGSWFPTAASAEATPTELNLSLYTCWSE
jgi:hypothetical protein